ncbi:MAG TPA: hypothetical protein VFE47_01015 [Tepidisphaeraceae bacterium]|jgi:uncharacterized delta-60 repeat protein|nr:hypothetical protein [Tepidisphaeraceae bacterium]
MPIGKKQASIRSSRRFSAVRQAVETLEQRLCLSAGASDPTFGLGGTAFGELIPYGSASATALQSDGKIIAAGTDSGGGFALARFDANGLVDRTFGNGGKVYTNLGTPEETITAAAVQKDGKIVVVGNSQDQAQGKSSIVVARYLSTGALDTTFGTKGLATISFLDFDTASSLVIQSNGNIVVGGMAQSGLSGANGDFALARLTTAGKLDTTFGAAGRVMTAFPSAGGGIDSLLLQPNGDLVASGSVGTSEDGTGTFNLTLARYLPSGALDTSFGTKGIVSSAIIPPLGEGGFGGAYVSAEPVVAALQSNGKIDVATTGSIVTQPYSDSNTLYVARFNINGSLDTTFGSKGLTSYANGSFIQPTDALIQKNGDIVVAGTSEYSTPVNGIEEFLFVRFSTTGVRGTVTNTPLADSSGGNEVSMVGAALEQPNQDIVMVGSSNIGTTSDFALARYTLAGTLDTSFGYHGAVQQSNGITGLVNGIATQSDGKILIVGSELTPDAATQPTDAAIARYNANGTLDTTFGTDGRVYLRLGNSAHWNAIKVLSNGDILVAGSGQVGTSTEFAMVRYLPSGAYDQSFGSGGLVTTVVDSKSVYQVCNALTIQSNGDIVAAGYATQNGNNLFAVARYLSNGKLDSTFGAGGKQTLTFSKGSAIATGVAILKNNDVLLAGTVGGSFQLEALLPNGSVDTTFLNSASGNGVTSFAAGPATLNALAIDPTTGDIVAGGAVSSDEGEEGILARYTQNGKLDPTFGTGGIIALAPNGNDVISSIAIQSNGEIVTGGASAGESYNSGNQAHPNLQGPPTTYATVARFTSKGLDTTFGVDGFVYLDNGAAFNATNAVVALQSNGNILAADVDLYRLTGK